LARTNIAVDDKTATMLADEAARANKTLYSFSNECLDADLKIFQEHGSVDEIYPFWLQTRMSKEIDGMPLLNRGIVDSMVKTFYPRNSEVLLKIFFKCGILFGSYIKMRFKDMDEVWNLIKLFSLSLPARVFEMDRTEDQSGKSYVMRYVSGISVETTVCLAKYFDGIFSCYSSNRQSRTSSSGVIEMEIRSE
jgi:hypothetical protein